MKYRVLELVKYNGCSVYLCQQKKFLFWRTLRTCSNMYDARKTVEEKFRTLNMQKGDKIKKKIIRWHSDNES